MSGVHFAAPEWVHLLWLVGAIIASLAWLDGRGRAALSRFAGPTLHAQLVQRPSRAQQFLRLAFLALFGVFCTLALMRPQWGISLVTTPRVGAEIMISLDVSRSMLAEDAAPNRLGRAKADIRDLLTYLDGDQVGLIAFAGRASVMSPLTPDFGFVRLVLDEVGPHSVTRGGTRLEAPIRAALAGFGPLTPASDGSETTVSRSILLITDGEDHDSFPREAAKAAAERGVRIIAIGFGDENGTEIRVTDPATGVQSVVTDDNGAPVQTRLDGDLLRELALLTDGAYIPAGTGVLDLKSIHARHIAPLTRGKLDGRTRTIRNDAFQWAALLALLSLCGAAYYSGRRSRPLSPSMTAASMRNTHRVTVSGGVATALLLTHVIASSPANADDERPKSAAVAPPESTPAAVAAEADGSAPKDPRSARARYNAGLESVATGTPDDAIEHFTEARNRSGTDAELRYRAVYALGWAHVAKADTVLSEAPQDALEALNRAAIWFREAIELRNDAEDARYNLDIVQRRITALADSLSKKNETTLEQELEVLIAKQRELLASIGEEIRTSASSQLSPSQTVNATDEARRSHRALAAQQLTVLAAVSELRERVEKELIPLEKTPEAERTPENALRQSQLARVSHYVHSAEDKLNRTRRRLRRVQSEPAFRRANGALDALKRAREQLLDPVQRLDQLIADSASVHQVAAASTVPESRPPWASDAYFGEAQRSLTERTTEFASGLDNALAQAESSPPTQPPLQTPPNMSGANGNSPNGAPTEEAAQRRELLAQLEAAAPHITAARTAFEEADTAALDGNVVALSDLQRNAIESLVAAREQFLDLRRLVELVFQTHQRVESGLQQLAATGTTTQTNASPTTGIANSPEPRDALIVHHEKNVARSARLGEKLVDALTKDAENTPPAGSSPAQPGPSPEKQRLEKGYEHWRAANVALHDTAAALTEPTKLQEARGAAATASEQLQALRRLFFSIIDHLKETAEHQRNLADETDAARTLASNATVDPGPFIPRQDALRERAASLKSALIEQANAPAPASAQGGASPSTSGPNQGGNDAEQRETLRAAATDVEAATEAMSQAGTALRERTFDASLEGQQAAISALQEAIAKLTPPQQDPSQSNENEDDSSEDEGSGNESESQQQQAANDASGGQPQPQSEQPPRDASENFAQLLRQVREREAQRRAASTERQRARNYAPVEKDW